MTNSDYNEDAAVTAGLEEMRGAAPNTILPGVMVATGLADGYVVYETAIGPVGVAFNEVGVTSVIPAADEATFSRAHLELTGRDAYPTGELPRRLKGRLERALESGRLGDLPVDLSRVTPFQEAVLRKTAEIGPGEVRPYSWVAREIDRPGAVRAVGTALASNPIPVLIPCHRVVKADGSLGNYALGPDSKRELLEAEGLDTVRFEAEAAAGTRFSGSDTTRIYCHPTCRHARRAGEKHKVVFRSAAEAAAARYRPCLVCRPEAVAA